MSNPLREAPFFQVANVNPDDPIRFVLSHIPILLEYANTTDANSDSILLFSVQIEQIEQLNTLLLQDIDHNFARFHDVVNNKILPQVKKYALVSQSTQEASRVSISLAGRLTSIVRTNTDRLNPCVIVLGNLFQRRCFRPYRCRGPRPRSNSR